MVRTNDRSKGSQRRDMANDLCSDHRVRPHQCPLLLRQRTVFLQDGVRDGDLTDIMQIPCQREHLRFRGRHAEGEGQLKHEVGDTPKTLTQLDISATLGELEHMFPAFLKGGWTGTWGRLPVQPNCSLTLASVPKGEPMLASEPI